MIVLRNIASHFPARAPEWVTSAGLTAWGVSLLGADPVFAGNRYLANLGTIASEGTWGTIAILVGSLRLAALFVNGTYPGFRHSPHLRAMSGFIACFVWAQVWIGLLASPTGRVAYAMILAIEMINVWRAAGDMGAMRAQDANT